MKKIMFYIFVCLTFNSYCQDLTIDLPTARGAFQSYHPYLETFDTSRLCMSDKDYLVGDNLDVTTEITIVNMGNSDAVLIDSRNSFFDTCQANSTLYWDFNGIASNFIEVSLLDSCGNVVTSHFNKMLYGIENSYKYGYYIDGNGEVKCNWTQEQINWLSSLAPLPDSSTAFSQKTIFNTPTQQGLSPFWSESYPSYFIGQWTIMNGLPNGLYFQKYKLIVPSWINQGANIYPDSILIPFKWETKFGNGFATMLDENVKPANCVSLPACDNSNRDPNTISINTSNKTVSWDSTGACNFNDLKRWIVCEKRNMPTQNFSEETFTITTETSFVDITALTDRDLQRAGRLIPTAYSGGKFSYKYKIGNTVSNKVTY
jgi:hypothetical protein